MSEIGIKEIDSQKYSSFTNIFKNTQKQGVVGIYWLRNKDTIKFWEKNSNPDFNPIEFDGFRNSTAISQVRSLVENKAVKRWRDDNG